MSKFKENLKENLIDLGKTVIVSVVIVYTLTTFVFAPVRIEGRSMQPTFTDGSFAILGVVTLLGDIDRFDIVSIDVPVTDEAIIKRIVGLPNEVIEYKDNLLYVDGVLVEETFERSSETENFGYKLAEGEYFVLGDNRSNSADSRYYGTFTKDDIVTKDVWLTFGG